jgi:hypothetical protein
MILPAVITSKYFSYCNINIFHAIKHYLNVYTLYTSQRSTTTQNFKTLYGTAAILHVFPMLSNSTKIILMSADETGSKQIVGWKNTLMRL